MEKTLKACQNLMNVGDESDIEENDGFVMVSTENNASLVNCSKVVVGSELNGPINVENMILYSKNDTHEDKSSNTEYNVGSIIEMFNLEGLKLLEEAFKNNPRPDKAERDRLAQATGTRRKMVRKWFAIERAKREKELSLKKPLRTAAVFWSHWSKKFRRKVKILTSLLFIYIVASIYCLHYGSWNQFIITITTGFLLIHCCTFIL